MSTQGLPRYLSLIEKAKVHIFFLALIVFVSRDIWNGNARPEAIYVLAVVSAMYPVILIMGWFLGRWGERFREKAVKQFVIDYRAAPERLRRKRGLQRFGVFLFLLAGGLLFIHLGHRGFLIDHILPAHYLGYFLLFVCWLGATGNNIWHGGPFDPRLDPPAPQDTDDRGG